MSIVQNILQSKRKPKEKVTFLASEAKKNKNILEEIVEYFDKGSVAEKGNCIEVMEYVSQEKPELVLPHLEFVLKNINHNAPKVKWETARVLGNLAPKFRKEASKAVEKLLLNVSDKGTVVRWSSAYALTEIAKANPKLQKSLADKFKKILKHETNNGVKNIYLKYLKSHADK